MATLVYLLLGVLAALAAPAAAADEAKPKKPPAWRLEMSGPADDPTRFCVLLGPKTRDGSSMALRLDRDLALEASFANDRWYLVASPRPMSVEVDGREIGSAVASHPAPQLVRLPLQPAEPALAAVRAGKALSLTVDGRTLRFPLRGHKRAVDRLLQCAKTGRLPQQARVRPDDAGAVQARQAYEALVRAVLAEAGMGDVAFILKQPDGRPADPFTVVWQANDTGSLSGVVGTARADEADPADSLRRSLERLNGECRGKSSIVETPAADVEGATVFEAAAFCHAGRAESGIGKTLVVVGRYATLFTHLGDADEVVAFNARLRSPDVAAILVEVFRED